MVCSGVPEKNDHHAAEVSKMGLDLLAKVWNSHTELKMHMQWLLKGHRWPLFKEILKKLLILVLDAFWIFSKFYGKVIVLSWILFQLI